jgi:hypothetical protein
LKWIPGHAKYCSIKDVDSLHLATCKKLGIIDVYENLQWRFEPRFRCIYGQAEYWGEKGKMEWLIRYASKYWMLLSENERRNIIVHEICHLAVESLYGHCGRPKKGEELVADHGSHWQKLMIKCGEDPY